MYYSSCYCCHNRDFDYTLRPTGHISHLKNTSYKLTSLHFSSYEYTSYVYHLQTFLAFRRRFHGAGVV